MSLRERLWWRPYEDGIVDSGLIKELEKFCPYNKGNMKLFSADYEKFPRVSTYLQSKYGVKEVTICYLRSDTYRPKNGDDFWMITVDRGPFCTQWEDNSVCEIFYREGNCYKTEEEAEKAFQRVRRALVGSNDVST